MKKLLILAVSIFGFIPSHTFAQDTYFKGVGSNFWATSLSDDEPRLAGWWSEEPCSYINATLVVEQSSGFNSVKLPTDKFTYFLMDNNSTHKFEYHPEGCQISRWGLSNTEFGVEDFHNLRLLGKRVDCPENICKSGSNEIVDDLCLMDSKLHSNERFYQPKNGTEAERRQLGKRGVEYIMFFDGGYAAVASHEYVRSESSYWENDEIDWDATVMGRIIKVNKDVRNPTELLAELKKSFKSEDSSVCARNRNVTEGLVSKDP